MRQFFSVFQSLFFSPIWYQNGSKISPGSAGYSLLKEAPIPFPPPPTFPVKRSGGFDIETDGNSVTALKMIHLCSPRIFGRKWTWNHQRAYLFVFAEEKRKYQNFETVFTRPVLTEFNLPEAIINKVCRATRGDVKFPITWQLEEHS